LKLIQILGPLDALPKASSGHENGRIQAGFTMFAIPLACLSLTVFGQAGTNNSDTITKNNVVLASDTDRRDKNIARLGAEIQTALDDGKKKSLLALRGEIEKVLKNSTSQAKVDQEGKFLLRKVLADIDRLAQLDQDPEKRAEIENLFAYLAGGIPPDGVYPAGLGETPLAKRHRVMQSKASLLIGPASFIRLKTLASTFTLIANECCRGQMPDTDLQSELEKEFAPYLNSDWADNWSFQLIYGKLMAMVYLSNKGRNHEKLAKLIKELDVINLGYSGKDSAYFLDTISYKFAMLVQQGRHQECIQEFKKIPLAQLNASSVDEQICLIDIYLSAAQSYEAAGKKDLALLQQELAFSYCLQLNPPKLFLVRFKKSVAKDLRDKLANNNKWKEVRNLEERCQLLGLAFDRMPKQPFE
jgi:hypothetical protein